MKAGDTIKCSSKEEMIDLMTELEKEDIHTDFLYERRRCKRVLVRSCKSLLRRVID